MPRAKCEMKNFRKESSRQSTKYCCMIVEEDIYIYIKSKTRFYLWYTPDQTSVIISKKRVVFSTLLPGSVTVPGREFTVGIFSGSVFSNFYNLNSAAAATWPHPPADTDSP